MSAREATVTLVNMVRDGELETLPELLRLIDQNADVNGVDTEGWAPINWAAYSGNIPVCKMLLQHKADVKTPQNKFGSSAFMAAAYSECLDTIKLILDHKADVNQKDTHGKTALSKSLIRGNYNVVRFILETAPEVNMNEIFIENGVSCNMLMMMTLQPGLGIMLPLLIEHGMDINDTNEDGMTALMLLAALRTDDFVHETLNLLLELKADVHMTDNYGSTPLMIAQWCSNSECADVLQKVTNIKKVKSERHCR